MFRRTASRIAIASAAALVASAALAAPALADGGPVAPKQYFQGEVFGLPSPVAGPNPIEVACAGPATAGRVVAGQYGAAHQLFPPAASITGYTGNLGTQIDVNLTYSTGTITVVTPVFAKIAFYDQKVEIPTSLTAPCHGTGVLDFAPNPNDGTGKSSNVTVTFWSPGV